jgi:outer membrane protein insertion porin family
MPSGLAAQGVPAAQDQPASEPPASPPGEEFDGRPVRRVDLVRPGLGESGPTLVPLEGRSLDFARNQVRVLPGTPYRQRTVTEDVERLSRTGRYSSIEAGVRLYADGSVGVVYTIVEQPIIEDVLSVGNRELTDQQIRQSVDLLVGTPVDLFQLDRAARRIEDLYHAKGYYNAQVDWDRRELEDNGIVLFRVTEGQKLRVTDIRFVGVESVPVGELRREIKTRRPFLFSKAPLDDDILDTDVASIYNFYQDRGYLDARVDRRVQPAPNNREAVVTFIVDEGPLYHLGDVVMQTADPEPRFSPEQLVGVMPIKRGDPYSINRVREGVDRVREAYHKEGFADVRVSTDQLRRDDEPVVDLLLTVRQGEARLIGEVTPIGNTKTRTGVVLTPLHDEGVRPEWPLDPTAMRRAEDRLTQRNIFDRLLEPPRISIQALPPSPGRARAVDAAPGAGPEAGTGVDQEGAPEGSGQESAPQEEAPGARMRTERPRDPYDDVYRDVAVEVRETDTGEFNVGAAFNTDSGVVARIAIVQRNFDLTDTPDTFGDLLTGEAFRGGGQTLSLELLPGNRVQTYSLSLSEPSLFGTDYSGSGSVFYRNRNFLNYSEERVGGRLGFGRRFGTRWRGNALVRLESIQLSDIDADQPVDVFDSAERALLAGLGFSLTRNTLDNRFRPRRGARTEVGIEQVGGDYTFTKLNAEHEFFVPVAEDFLGRTTVFSTKVAASYIPQNKDDVPVYERYYLGGQSFRGFDFRAVSPIGIRNDTGELGDDPVGGTWSFFLGSQVVHPLIEEIISGVVFVDTGTVGNDVGFDDYRVSVGLGVRLYVPQISPAPIGFDFGFPVLEEPTDKNRVFTFFIDLPF